MPYITSIERIGRAEGRLEGEISLVLRQLSRRFGVMPEQIRAQISALPLAQLEILGEDLLDFMSMADLEAWLNQSLEPRLHSFTGAPP